MIEVQGDARGDVMPAKGKPARLKHPWRHPEYIEAQKVKNDLGNKAILNIEGICKCSVRALLRASIDRLEPHVRSINNVARCRLCGMLRAGMSDPATG